MGNKCVVYGCKSGYLSSASAEEKVSSFTFRFEKPDLLSKWVINLQIDQIGHQQNIQYICTKHFEDKFIFYGKGK